MLKTYSNLSTVLFLSIFLSMVSCGESEDQEETSNVVKYEESILDSDQSLNTTIDGKLFSIPSPIQMMDMIKSSGDGFDKTMLNKPESSVNYSTVNKKALNLGVYGTDLGYVTIFEQNEEALSYLKAVERLSDELGIAGAFDSQLIERIMDNSNDQDSMLILITEAYRKGDTFLKDNERTYISALILAGGWIESLYFAAKLAKNNNHAGLKQRIAEQSSSLTSLIELLKSTHNGDEIFDFLIDGFKDLKDVYVNISASYDFVQPITDPEKKLTIIKSSSTASIDEETLVLILEKINIIRNEIIS